MMRSSPSFHWSAGWRQRRAWLDDLVASGLLDSSRLDAARRALGLVPSGPGWVHIITGTLAAAGIGLIAAALIFAVAFNWDALGHFTRFALVQAVLIAFVAVAGWRGMQTLVGEAALFAACLATGALLALFGQTYQTGADPYSLFVVWALILLPWLLHARRASLWLLWLVIVDTALGLYCAQVLGESRWIRLWGHSEWSAVLAMALSGALLIAFEALPVLGAQALGRAVPRLCALSVLAGATAILAPFVMWRHHGRLGDAHLAGMAVFAFASFCAVALTYWRRRDLLILAAASLAAISIVYSFLLRGLDGLRDAFGFFMLSAAYWIGSITWAVLWLRGLDVEQQREKERKQGADAPEDHQQLGKEVS